MDSYSQSISDIAIIGIHGRFPQSETIQNFWSNLCECRNCIEALPKNRWKMFKKNDIPAIWGGFIRDVDKFDANFFKISSKEATEMDPQQRLFLESVWSALEDAGYGNHPQNPKCKIGLFVGTMWHDYSLYCHELGYMQNRYCGLGSLAWAIANRTSFIMNFSGPSIAIDTACASSAMAIHLGCQSLLMNECEIAIAGGVNLNLHPSKYIFLSHEKLLASSPNKACFQPGAEGYLPSEGVGSIVLKRLPKALVDGDHIYAVIKGTVANHSGRGMFFRMPDSGAQTRLICELLKKINLNPRTISYMEMFALGSELVDQSEFNGLCNGFHNFTHDNQFCALGTLKPNIGHMEAASAISQIIKVVLQFTYHKLLPAKFYDKIPPDLKLECSPFYLQRSLNDWNSIELEVDGEIKIIPRRAGINSFGAGGSNVHMILEEYLQDQDEKTRDDTTILSQLVVLSAKNHNRLLAVVKQILTFIEHNHDFSLTNFAYTLQVGREAMESRLAMIVNNKEELARGLKSILEQKGIDSLIPFYWEDLKENYLHNSCHKGKRTIKYGGILNEEELKKIAYYWTQGGKIFWESFYENQKVFKISLPSYPFDGEYYWI
jgi:acyl transferase domain-containing protein